MSILNVWPFRYPLGVYISPDCCNSLLTITATSALVITQEELQQEMVKIGNFMQQNGLKKNGLFVTTTFSIDQTGTSPILDMEILVPLDKEFLLSEPYRMKKVFHLKHAVYARHEGNPQLLQNTLNSMVQYIQNKNLQQITPAYNVTVNEPKSGQGLDKLIIDAYIGVNPSI